MIITTTHGNIINIIHVMTNLLKYTRPARWQINNELTNTPWHTHANKTTIMTTRMISLVIINESMETWPRRGVEVRAIFVEKRKIYHNNMINVVIRLTRTRTYHYSAWNENDRGSMPRLFWWNRTSQCILINYPIQTHFSTIYYDLL